MPRVTIADLQKAREVLEDHLENEANDPAITRVADWLVAEIESRNIRAVAREHGLPTAAVRERIRETET